MSEAPDPEWPLQPEPLRPPSLPAQLMRASDSDRDGIAQQLAVAFAEGRLSVEEHADRLDRAMQAKTLGELATLTHDLQTAPTAPTPERIWEVDPSARARDRLVIAIFGGARRSGRWRVPARLDNVAVFGGIDLDLRSAVFTSPTVELNLACIFGGAKIILPPGVNVVNDIVSIFGGATVQRGDVEITGAPTVRITGLCLFGGAEVVCAEADEPPAPPLR